MQTLRRAADVNDANSLSQRLRARRFAAFERAVDGLSRPIRVIDVGGTVAYWRHRGWAGRDDIHITVVNLEAEPCPYPNLVTVAGDAARLEAFTTQSFDIAFSNSVIEHVGDRARQAAMAREMRRVAAAHWIQTPNYWFPMEPHFLVPGWQWLPARVRIAILQRHGVGHFNRTRAREDASHAVRGIQLLSRRELRRLFPDSVLIPERYGGLVKSWTIASPSLCRP